MTATDLDPKTFDVDAFLGQFKPANKTARLPWDASISARLADLRGKIKDKQDTEAEDSAVGDTDLPGLIREYNELVDKFKTESTEFEFRPPEAADFLKARAAMEADDIDIEAPGSQEAMLPYLWAVVCVSPAGMTGKTFAALRSRLGDVAMYVIQDTWNSLNQIGDVSAPFSPLPLPSRTATKRSRS